MTLIEQFGPIDIYLFDQILRGRIASGMRILDAGCGGGRNLVYLFREGYEVYGCDANPTAIAEVRRLTAELGVRAAPDAFRVEPMENMSFPDEFADVVIASAVLHFAPNEAAFKSMLRGCWRVLRPGGLLFCRLASSIGIEGQVRQIEGRRFQLPDGSERYLADEAMLLRWTAALGGELVDPLKTTVVQDQRAMTTWVVRKSP